MILFLNSSFLFVELFPWNHFPRVSFSLSLRPLPPSPYLSFPLPPSLPPSSLSPFLLSVPVPLSLSSRSLLSFLI